MGPSLHSPASSKSARTAGRQPPHRVPAPHRSDTSAGSWAPPSTAARIARSVTARQWQMYTPAT